MLEQAKLIEHFVASLTATTAVGLVWFNEMSAAYYYYRLRELICRAIADDKATPCCPAIMLLMFSGFRYLRINHSKFFAAGKNHINGIENFWNQAKRHFSTTTVPAVKQGEMKTMRTA